MPMNATTFQAIMQLDVKGQKKAVAQLGAVQKELGMIRMGMSRLAQASQALTMEFLGIMFFGMMLQKVFRGLLGPAMEVFGIMELWSTMLMVLFLPVIQEMFPFFLQMIEFFMNLDSSTKLLIGNFIVFMTMLGVFIMLFGQLGLGIFSIIRFIEVIIPLIQGMGISISAAFLAIVAIIVAVLVGIWLAWRENFGKMKEWFDVIFDGMKKILKGNIQIWKGDFFGGIITIAKGFVQTFIATLAIVGLGVFRIFVGIIRIIATLWWKLLQKLDQWSGGWATRFIDILLSISIFITKMIGKVTNLLSKIPGFGGLKGVGSISTEGLTAIRGNIRESGSVQNIEISQVFNISDKSEMERMIGDNNAKVVEDLFRLVKTPTS